MKFLSLQNADLTDAQQSGLSSYLKVPTPYTSQ